MINEQMSILTTDLVVLEAHAEDVCRLLEEGVPVDTDGVLDEEPSLGHTEMQKNNLTSGKQIFFFVLHLAGSFCGNVKDGSAKIGHPNCVHPEHKLTEC